MSKRRIWTIAIIIFISLSALLGRLMQIQLFQTEHFSKHQVNLLEESVKQRVQQVELDDGRGVFLDRHNKALSYEEETIAIIFPFLKQSETSMQEIAKITGYSFDDLNTAIQDTKEPLIIEHINADQEKQLNNLQIPGLLAMKRKKGNDPPIAAQFIGLSGQNENKFKQKYPDKKNPNLKIGITGLQERFDEFLYSERPSKLIFHVDGRGDPLFGLDVKYTEETNPFYPLNIKTTVDRKIQELLEEKLEEANMKNGGAVLLDVQTNDIVALASRPHINSNKPFDDDGTKNRVFQQHIPGSVFKTVIAAAAIEKGLITSDDVYNCSLSIRGEKANKDLGTLSFEESFSRSCNRTFAELAVSLQEQDDQIIESYAKKMGLVGDIAWTGDVFSLRDFHHFSHEEGQVFVDDEARNDKNLVAQTGIGQQEVRVTPIGAANMMAMIARGGKQKPVRAALEIQYANGGSLFSFSEDKGEQSLSTETSMRLQQLLRLVITDEQGTSASLQELPFEVAGKTGTAETGKTQDGKKINHKWFAGYFPFQQPQYALVIVNLDVYEDEGSVLPIFREIVTGIHDLQEIRGREAMPIH